MSTTRPSRLSAPVTGRAGTAGSGAPDDYELFCTGVRNLAKVDLSQYKRGQMERRIRTFAKKKGTEDLGVYLSKLKADEAELNEFLDRITINVSQLWRNPEQWTVLQRTLLPELAAETGQVRCWSAGSSYGAEAYTLAAVAKDAVPKAKLSVNGTDIDRRIIARAKQGYFSADDARSAPKAALTRWFEPDADGGWTASSELKSIVRFEQGDLLRMPFPKAAYDLVLCRNTVIYFNEPIRDALHERLVGALRPGGYLVIGSTERVANAREIGLTNVRPFVYRNAA